MFWGPELVCNRIGAFMYRISSDIVLYSDKVNGMEEHDMMRLKPTQRRNGGKPRRYFSNFKWKGKKIEVALNATEYEKHKALTELGNLFSLLRSGIEPNRVRQKIKKLKIPGVIDERNQGILDKHLYPFFGESLFNDIDEIKIAAYIEHRFGLNDKGKLQAVHNTIDKELILFQKLLRCADKIFKLPRPDYERMAEKGKDLPPLTFQQVEHAAPFMPKTYLSVYWVMAFTALDIGDALDLRQGQVKNGWIDRKRNKTGRPIHLPVCPELAEVFKGLPRNLDPDAVLFPDLVGHRVSKGIIAGFKRADLPGYGSKKFRHFLASLMQNDGFSTELVAKMLAHAEGSKITDDYIKIYDDTMIQAFGQVAKVRAANG